MQTGGEAADQIVKMSLEGADFAIRLAGDGAVRIASILVSILREENKTRGKARLDFMLRSGKELKVFTIRNADLKKFTQEAKKYGVLYNVLANRRNNDPNLPVDIIARAEDAAKIDRIIERFKLASQDIASVIAEAEQQTEKENEQAAEQPARDWEQDEADKEHLLDELFGKVDTEADKQNPTQARIKNDPLSEPTSERQSVSGADEVMSHRRRRPSVRAELNEIKQQRRMREEQRKAVVPEPSKKPQKTKSITHQQPIRNPKNKPRGR